MHTSRDKSKFERVPRIFGAFLAVWPIHCPENPDTRVGLVLVKGSQGRRSPNLRPVIFLHDDSTFGTEIGDLRGELVLLHRLGADLLGTPRLLSEAEK